MNALERFGRKKGGKPSAAMKKRQELYAQAKSLGIKLEWKRASIKILEESLENYNSKNMSKIYDFLSSSQLKRIDTRNLRTISSLNDGETFELSSERFNRIIKRLSAGEDRYLFVNLKDRYGSTVKSINLNNKHFENENIFIDITQGVGSDADFNINEDLTDGSVMVQWIKKKKYQSKRSEFFRYLTKEYYGLEDFQVYNFINPDCKETEIPCFLFALQMAGVKEEIISAIRTTMYTYAATHDFIRKTAVNFNLNICLLTYKEKESRFDFNKTNYGDKTQPLIELACVGQHLFAIKDTSVSQHALNYPQFASHPSFPSIRVKNGRVVKNGVAKTLPSHKVIAHLYFNKETLLIPITLENAPKLLNNKYGEIDHLTNIALNKKWFKKIGLTCTEVDDFVVKEGEINGKHPFTSIVDKKVVEEEFQTVYFDLETFTDSTSNIAKRFPEVAENHKNGEHVAYCASWKIDDQPIECSFGLDCVNVMLSSLPPSGNFLMLAHNAGFDVRFLIRELSSFDTQMGIIESGNCVKQLGGYFNGRKIVIKDTMSFIAGSLAGMPAMFPGACKELTLEKESFPHDLMNTFSFDTNLSLELIKAKFQDADNLITNASNIGAIYNDELDTVKYAIHYCKRDVMVLASCFERFREMFITRFKQDVYRHISMPGLAYAILNNEGCYDGCYSMAGPCLSFVRKAIVGGRVMTRDNEKHHTKHNVEDFDAVSLYPSAMARLPGFARGKPKIHGETIPKCDYYISRVKILSLGKKLHFPLQSSMKRTEKRSLNAKGKLVKTISEARDFTNDIVGKTIIIDQYALEDLIKFQNVTYEVIEGLYWNEGFNKKIVGGITKLFEERLKFKLQGNPLQGGIKLLLNSSYGKLIQKPIVKSKTIIRGRELIDDYTNKRINRLIQRTPISDDIALFEEHKALSKHFSPAHLGVQILSMSKRIMNEVMCLAEEEDQKMWYQDTDSIHIDSASVSKLATKFSEKYGRDLIGKQLGQFHSDFDLKGSEGSVYATESWFIGKKTYLDVLKCTGNKVTGFHARMKGIPSKLITDPVKTYSELFDGIDQTFDLSLACPIKIDNKAQRVMKRNSFIRKVSA